MELLIGIILFIVSSFLVYLISICFEIARDRMKIEIITFKHTKNEETHT